MSRHIKIYSSSSGINNKLDPVRLEYDYRKGVSDLAACVNCTIDDSGRIARREGFTATDRTEAWHSLFSCGAYALGVMGDALCVIEPNMSYSALRNVQVGAKVSFVRATDGKSDIIFYANGHENGLIKNKISYSWPLITPVGAATIKEFYPAPIGSLLEVRNGRMFIAKDNYLYYSEPGSYHAYRLASGFFGFQSRIKMVQAVSSIQGGGLWVSDSESIFWLGGNIAPTMQEMPVQIKRADYAVIENTAVKIPASRVGIEGLSGIVIIFATSEGICLGSADGQLINITERKIDMPAGLSGSSFYKNGHLIVCID